MDIESGEQKYAFPVNTFPAKSKVKVDGLKLREGYDFIVDPRSGSYAGTATYQVLDSVALLVKNVVKVDDGVIPVIDTRGIDTPDEVNVQFDFVKRAIERGPVVLLKEKLTWSVGVQSYTFPIVEVLASAFPSGEGKLSMKVEPQMIYFEAANVIGKVAGRRSDSCMVFTAHYDHLGKMGNALFAGASDNASGTAMLLDLAGHYAESQPEFDTYFLFFSGEEAGLVGSKYFVQEPTFDLSAVKFLINLDLMGSAAKGITIVNGRLHTEEMKRLAAINTENDLLPKVKLRGKAANSDHYWFSEAGVPAIFIYTEGNITAYHDVYDTTNVVDWINYEEVFTLLVEFVKTF
jgi:putative aminopeptidase FrvX